MKEAIGMGSTKGDHGGLSVQLYTAYAKGREIRELVEVVGEESLTDEDKLYLDFALNFENKFLNQGMTNWMIFETLEIGWSLLGIFHHPTRQLMRIDAAHIEKYHPILKIEILITILLRSIDREWQSSITYCIIIRKLAKQNVSYINNFKIY